MDSFPPANKVQQVVSVDAQGFVRQTADILAVEVAIDPANLPAGLLFNHANGNLSSVRGLKFDDTELHS